MIVLAIVAAAAYGAYRLAARPEVAAGPDSGLKTSTTVAVAGQTTTSLPNTTATTGAVGASGAVITGTPTILPNLAPQPLEIQTDPDGADLTITLQDKTTLTGVTPFSQDVPGGAISVTVRKPGYNAATRQLTLKSPESLKMWLDPEGQLYQSLVRFKCGRQPKQVAFSPDGKELWVSILGNGGLQVFDPFTGEKIGQVDMGGREAVELIFTRDGKTVWASQMSTSTIWEVDRATRKVRRHFKSGGNWTKILLLSPDEKTLYASNWLSNDVSEIDVATGKVKRMIKTVATPRGLYVTPNGKTLYVGGFGTGQIQRIDLDTLEKKVLIKTGGSMRHMVADESKRKLYVGEFGDSEIYVVDLATDEVTKLADTDQRPNTIDLSPDGKVLYVSNRGKDNPKSYLIKGPEWGSVLAIDTASGKVLDAIVGGNQCTGLDVSPDGKLLAFSDFLDYVIRIYTIPDYDYLAAGNGGRAATHLKDLVKD